MGCSRREFLAATAGILPLSHMGYAVGGRRPRIAALSSIYRRYSHSQHIVDRFLKGYSWEGRQHRPPMDLVSLYVEQVGENDLSHERARRYPQMKIYPTIAEALTLGGKELAVDGVLLIAEHGKYPDNERGQKLYPRYEYFQQVVDVYRQSGRTAPVFNDKHLSWNWEWAKEMVETAREMNFGLMAGSSLPVSRRLPAIDLPWGADVEEVVAVGCSSVDGGDIHLMEAMQSIVERRRGGETGVVSVEALEGERFWNALELGSWEAGGWDVKLMEAALSRSDTLFPIRSDYGGTFPTMDELHQTNPNSRAYRFEYADGTKATMIQMQKMVQDHSVAVRFKDGNLFSVLMYLPYYTMHNFFNPQVHHVESLFLTGKSPYPIERTLLTTGMTASAIESLFQKQTRLETPHLAIQYQPTRESTFWNT